MGAIEAVVFDLGGVVMESPLHSIAGYEQDHDLPGGTINQVVVESGEEGAWARLERGELTVEASCRAAGCVLSSLAGGVHEQRRDDPWSRRRDAAR